LNPLFSIFPPAKRFGSTCGFSPAQTQLA
jgi:hypothetical protein